MHRTSEPDVEVDPQVARSREAGGVDPDQKDGPVDERAFPDGPSTTGTDQNEQFVGRVAGQDAGYTGETGAEARAQRAVPDQAREPAGAKRRHKQEEDW